MLFAVTGYFALTEFSGLLDSLLPGWLDWLRWLLWPLFGTVLLVGEFYLCSMLANLIAAPFNALLAAKLVTQLSPAGAPSASHELRILENIRDEWRKLRYQGLWALPWVVLSFIPPINVIAPFAWFVYGSWMLAIEYLDYPLGEVGLTFEAQRQLVKQHRAAMLGFGAVILVLSAVPVLNFVMIPVAVAGACGFWHARLESATHQPGLHAPDSLAKLGQR